MGKLGCLKYFTILWMLESTTKLILQVSIVYCILKHISEYYKNILKYTWVA